MIDLHKAFSFGPVPQGQQRIQVDWDCPVELPYYEGHFPGQAILPGAAVLDASLLLAQKAWGEQLRLRKVISAKFVSPVLPGMKIRIIAERLSAEASATECNYQWVNLESGEPLAEVSYVLDFATASAAKL